MAERKNSEKRIASNNKWTNAHYDRVNLALPKGQKDRIQAHAVALGESVNGFVSRVVMEAMERDVPQGAVGVPTGAGAVSLPAETIKVAQEAAQAAGEAVQQFVLRAVKTQAERDKAFLKMGINPTTGQKLEQSGIESTEK